MIKVERKEGVKYLTIYNPERKNAIGIEDVKTLSREIDISWKERDIDALVITGHGDTFCSGLDLSVSYDDLKRKDAIDIIEWHVEEFTGVIRSLIECPKFVIGRINGSAAGFGAEIIYWLDYKIAERGVYLHETFPKRGLIPDGGGIPFLGRTVGPTRALSVLAYGDRISATDALELGIINEVAQGDAELDERVKNAVERIRKLSQGAVSKIKKLIWSHVFENLENHLRQLRVIQTHQVLSEDFQEGISAFLQKREPKFRKVL